MAKKREMTTISVTTESADRFDTLAKANGISKKELFSKMLDYFDNYGVNPIEHESPAKEMQRLIKRVDQVVAFTRTQERELLRPLLEKVVETDSRINKNINSVVTHDDFENLKDTLQKRITSESRKALFLKGQIEETNEKQIEERKAVKSQIDSSHEEIKKALIEIASHVDPKNKSGLLDKLNFLK